MSAYDLDPHFLLPLWQTLVRYFRAFPPVVHAPQQLALALPAPEPTKTRKARQIRRSSYRYLRALERQLPNQPSP